MTHSQYPVFVCLGVFFVIVVVVVFVICVLINDRRWYLSHSMSHSRIHSVSHSDEKDGASIS